MIFSFFKRQYYVSRFLNPVENLSLLFDKECSLSFNKTRSLQTKKLAEVIKKNSDLNKKFCFNNVTELTKEQLSDDLAKLQNILDAIDQWLKERKDKSERVEKIKSYRQAINSKYVNIFHEYQIVALSHDEVSRAVDNSKFRYKIYGFIISLPFIMQAFGSVMDFASSLS